MSTIELNVAGMTCGGCEQSIARALARVPGVASVTADHESGVVRVQAEETLARAAVEAAIEDAGYDVLPDDGKRLPLLS